MKGILLSAVLALGLVGMVGCGSGGGETGGDDKKLTVAVIPKGTTHVFWKSVEAGAKEAGEEFGVEVMWKGPLKEDDKDAQIKVVEDFVTKRVDGIVLAPLDDSALRVPVRDAQDQGIPVVIFDSGLNEVDTVSFVATDNFVAGKAGGMRLGELLNGEGKVVLLRYIEGSASTMEREEGFLEAMKEFPEIEVVSDNQYGGATGETAQAASETLLNRFMSGGEMGVDGIFTPNESTTFGMLRALQTAGIAGEVQFVGFDSSDQLVKGLERGEIHALVVQNPVKMGYLAVKTMVEKLKGEDVESRIDTGSEVVDQENMNDPEIAELVNPKS